MPNVIYVYEQLPNNPQTGVFAVDFHFYVEHVITPEWGSGEYYAAYEAGTLAIKDYGWYLVNNWQGFETSGGQCFNAYDNSRNQNFKSTYPVDPTAQLAVDDIWLTTELNPGPTVFPTSYGGGSLGDACGYIPSGEPSGTWMDQDGTETCASEGLNYNQIFDEYYYSPANDPALGLNDRIPDVAVNKSNDNQYVFWRGANNDLWETWYQGGAWSGPNDLGHLGFVNLDSSPVAAVNYSNGNQYVFWKGDDGTLQEAFHTSSGWSSRVSFCSTCTYPSGVLGSSPGVAVDSSTGHEFVFWKGTDANLYEMYWNNSSWVGPTDLGDGPLSSGPSVATNSSQDIQYVFWAGTDGYIWDAYWNTSGWQGPFQRAYSAVGDAPSVAVADTSGEIALYWKGNNGNWWQAYNTGSGWGSATGSGQAVDCAPTAAADLSGNLWVFWAGSNGDVWESWYTSSSWNGPQDKGWGNLPLL
jgi:hypothetical protein